MNLNQIEIKSKPNNHQIDIIALKTQFIAKLNLKQYLPENWAILNQISTKIDEKWDKNKNNGFGFGPQNSQWNWPILNENQWNLIIKFLKIEWNFR